MYHCIAFKVYKFLAKKLNLRFRNIKIRWLEALVFLLLHDQWTVQTLIFVEVHLSFVISLLPSFSLKVCLWRAFGKLKWSWLLNTCASKS